MYEPDKILFFCGLQALTSKSNGGVSDTGCAGQKDDLAQEQYEYQQQFHVSGDYNPTRNIEGPHQKFQRESYFTNCWPRNNQEAATYQAETTNIYYSEQETPSLECRRGVELFDSCAQSASLHHLTG